MFSLPQPPTGDDQSGDTQAQCGLESRDGLPVIPMAEDSRTVEKLLRICYPGRHPAIDDLMTLRTLLAAATKYVMDEVTEVLRDALCAFAQTMPLQVYAIAIQYRFEKETREAARRFLNHKFVLENVPELANIPASAYCRLPTYRERCSQIARESQDAIRKFDFC
ncbi:hypothetical protein BKA93DRAFT_500853 [Sparassis latifolia]